ncbi:MAG: P22 phage major capsid protein family protein [Candidatus Thiodiazotropha sp.]
MSSQENQLITPQVITDESLRLLHDKMPFVKRLNRRYSDEFDQGARHSDEVLVRHPNRYEVRSGATLKPQSTKETVTSLSLNSRKGVDLSVTSKDLTLHIDEFSHRYLEPAISTLASAIEADVLSTVLEDVVHAVALRSDTPSPDWYHGMGLLGIWFDMMLIPEDQRRLVMNSFDQAEMVDALKKYPQSSQAVSRQYETGQMGRFQGFDIGMSLSMPTRQRRGRVERGLDEFSLESGGRHILEEAAPASFDRVKVSRRGAEKGLKLPQKGDWITFDGVYPVHPETKDPVRSFALKPFKVVSVTGGEVVFTPPLIWRGAHQNASLSGGAKAFDSRLIKATADDKTYRWNLAFDKEAIAFVTADLALPKDVDFAHRSTYQEIALRVVRKYDINEDSFPCRIDVLYGSKLLRPDSVCLLVGNSDAA